MSLDLAAAEAVVAGARRAAKEKGLKPLAVVVLDSGGHLLAAQREDGASNKRCEIAYGKAHGAISLGMDSRDLMTRAEQQPYFIASATAALGGSLIPVPGGVLVYGTDGKIIGAVGISGDTSDNDEMAALAGLDAAGLPAVRS